MLLVLLLLWRCFGVVVAVVVVVGLFGPSFVLFWFVKSSSTSVAAVPFPERQPVRICAATVVVVVGFTIVVALLL